VPICAECGKENPAEARFCLACGTAFETEPTPAREERKVVTVLFCDLVGFTSRSEQLDPEEVSAMLAPYHARLRAELERYGGTVEKFIGDAVMAVFGAPVAHEDDPERAVRAALAIRDELREEGRLDVRIAVNTGEALVRLGARPQEGEGMVAGDVVNTAARLQAAAPVNGILVGQATYRATERVIDYREAEPVTAKGKADPVPVWEAAEARSRFGVDVRQQGRTPLVGRKRELDLLWDALQRAREEREPQLVTLVGVPGIGKSRLVWELFQRVDAEPEFVTWRQGRSLPYGEGVSFWALSEMVKAQAGILESDSVAQAAEKLEAAIATLDVQGNEDWLLRHLRPLVGLETDAPSADAAEPFGAWRRFFEALADEQPLVLVFEDLHWADEGLLDFVDELVDAVRGAPLLVVGTARPELMSRRSGWGGGKANALTISLSPLSDEDTARLANAVLERTVVPAELQSALLARAGGNPLFAEEFARLAAEREGDVELPDTVQALIAARLDSLPDAEKDLLQTAAVIGKVFWVGALGERATHEQLPALERKDFIRRERRSSVADETEYAFRHVLTRDVAYSQIPRAGRAQKHQATAAWIESLSPDRAEDRAEMLAHHYVSALEYARPTAGESDALVGRARLALREAGDRAMALSALSAAARYYRGALELWPPEDADRPRLLLAAGQAASQGEGAGAEELESAREALAAAGDVEGAAEAEALLGSLHWRRGDRERATRHVGHAHELVADLPPSRAKTFVLTVASGTAMVAGEDDKAAELAREVVRLGEALGLDELRVQALTTLGSVYSHDGDRGAFQFFAEALTIAEASRTPAILRTYANLAVAHFVWGEIQQAREVLRRGLELAESFGETQNGRWLRGLLPYSEFALGNWDAAVRAAESFLGERERLGTHYLQRDAHEVRAEIRLARDDVGGALEDVGAALTLGRDAGDPQALYPALATAAFVYANSGEGEKYSACAEELLTMWEATENRTPLYGSPLLAFALSSDRDRERLANQLERRREMIFPWYRVAESVIHDDFLGAAEIYAGAGDVTGEAYARLRAAGQLVGEGRRSEADQQLQRALAFYRSVGATRYIREGEHLLAESA
jgi:class 3 adenylate cyclase/tetratricopeptide (TPR) repeat protein